MWTCHVLKTEHSNSLTTAEVLDSSSSNCFKGLPSASLSLSLLSDIWLAEEAIVPFTSDPDSQLQLQSFSPESRAVVLMAFGLGVLLPCTLAPNCPTLPCMQAPEYANPRRAPARK